MTEGNLFKIDELIEFYELHPEARELFVEGRTDFFFFEWFFEKMGVSNIDIFEVDTVEKAEKTANALKLELKNNKRNMIIALAHELDSKLVNNDSVICVADKDFDLILNVSHSCSLLLFTDYANLEMYLYNKKVLKKYINFVLRGFHCSATFILTQLSKTLPEIFLIRLSNKLLKLNMRWEKTNLKRVCRYAKNHELCFDVEDFVKRILNNNKTLIKQVILKMKEFRNKLIGDIRNFIHGHDFINLLGLYFKKGDKDSKFFREDVFKGSLLTSLELEHIENETLFRTLKNWVKIS